MRSAAWGMSALNHHEALASITVNRFGIIKLRGYIMNSTSVFRIAAICAAATMALSACVVSPYPQSQVVYTQPAPGEIMVGVPPPAPYIEVIPVAPFLGAVWISGYWGWSGGRHQWVPGRYERPRPGYRWEPHHWVQGQRGNWHLRGGGWAR